MTHDYQVNKRCVFYLTIMTYVLKMTILTQEFKRDNDDLNVLLGANFKV